MICAAANLDVAVVGLVLDQFSFALELTMQR